MVASFTHFTLPGSCDKLTVTLYTLMRILGIDPGEKHIGIAISDPSGTIANPLLVLKHVSRAIDAASIAQTAQEKESKLIVVGQALDVDGKPTYSGRRAARLAAAIHTQTDIPIILWDESYSTQDARSAQINLGATRRKRSGHLDALAATVILQAYLDSQSTET
jgi:putative Holliday junction resolvase